MAQVFISFFPPTLPIEVSPLLNFPLAPLSPQLVNNHGGVWGVLEAKPLRVGGWENRQPKAEGIMGVTLIKLND